MHQFIWIMLSWYAVMSLLTFVMYVKDKSAAKRGQWRVPEIRLHLLSLLGGWIGAMMAQIILRHKSRKTKFQVIYYITVMVNIALLMVLVWGVGKL